MSILTVSVLGITAVLLAVQLKGKGSEYGTYIVMAAGLCLFFYAAGKLEVILKTLRTMESCIGISPVYLSALLKMAGITYIAEFASGICKDAGYGSLGTQIEIFAKAVHSGGQYADSAGIVGDGEAVFGVGKW